MNTVKYKCEKCGKETTVDSKAAVPECCGRKMKQLPLDVCSTTFDAETYRFQNEDGPCDEGFDNL
ncbi:MAG: hypothetical protein WCR31_12330 [Treponema sp.]